MVLWSWTSRTGAGGSAKIKFRGALWLILLTGGRDLFECFEDWVVTYGMPHHVIICQGHHKASLAKFASARGVKIV